MTWDFPGGPVAETLSQCRELPGRSLVRELDPTRYHESSDAEAKRSHMPQLRPDEAK